MWAWGLLVAGAALAVWLVRDQLAEWVGRLGDWLRLMLDVSDER